MPTRPLVLGFPGSRHAASTLARLVDGELGTATIKNFPDSESYVRVESDPHSRNVVVVATLNHPNVKLAPLLFLADALRDLGASRIGLVAPYLAYMRQDKRFHEGEAITSRTFAGVVSRAFDWLVTVDPHLHRFSTLAELYTIPADAVHVAALLGEWISENVNAPFIIGPDAESRQWAETIAASAKAPFTILQKTRRGDRDVIETIPDFRNHMTRTPVLVDDIISSGRTMLAALEHLRAQNTKPAVCVAVHAVFARGAYAELRAARPSRIVTTNTIAHATNCIDVLPALAGAVSARLARG